MAKLSPAMQQALDAIRREGKQGVVLESCTVGSKQSGSAYAPKTKLRINRRTLLSLAKRGLVKETFVSSQRYRPYHGQRTYYCSTTRFTLRGR